MKIYKNQIQTSGSDSYRIRAGGNFYNVPEEIKNMPTVFSS